MNNIEKQQRISQALGVNLIFDVETECAKRIAFLAAHLKKTNRQSLVLGVSGGIDSTVAARMAQLTVEQLRQTDYNAHFTAVRLPYGLQLDEPDAQCALAFIRPDELLVIDIKPACDQTLQSLKTSGFSFKSVWEEDFILGNIKARQRMIVQYALAGARQGLVVGTDHAAEALMGFFTKYGDGACDLAPLSGLSKRQIRALGQYLGASSSLVNKTPTADLESLAPLRRDEDVFGITYQQIDDFLEGKTVPIAVYNRIIEVYESTQHKRQLPYIITSDNHIQ